mmetsp:Transcript_52973/g.125080  ORF Transcript_52973/g.125080 Transcript_52973/m.125080 type:complete len:304 (-) Transcript_52973:516-1427(-)
MTMRLWAILGGKMTCSMNHGCASLRALGTSVFWPGVLSKSYHPSCGSRPDQAWMVKAGPGTFVVSVTPQMSQSFSKSARKNASGTNGTSQPVYSFPSSAAASSGMGPCGPMMVFCRRNLFSLPDALVMVSRSRNMSPSAKLSAISSSSSSSSPNLRAKKASVCSAVRRSRASSSNGLIPHQSARVQCFPASPFQFTHRQYRGSTCTQWSLFMNTVCTYSSSADIRFSLYSRKSTASRHSPRGSSSRSGFQSGSIDSKKLSGFRFERTNRQSESHTLKSQLGVIHAEPPHKCMPRGSSLSLETL